jgi:D-glucosaminate-6-phosphate ammonia-lyase
VRGDAEGGVDARAGVTNATSEEGDRSMQTRPSPAQGSRGTARDYLGELGVRPIVNAAGTYTKFTGSLMRPEAVEAIAAMSRRYVRLDELHDAVGRRIAGLLGCEAAMVTSGAAGALTLATVACMTGCDPDKIRRVPETAGMPTEVIIQRTHRFPYDHAVRNCGVRLVEIDSRADLERAAGDRTAALLFLNKAEPAGRIHAQEFVAIGKSLGIPTINDAAADVPPMETLFRLTRLGFDLVAISGGKGLQGPQNTGLLLGRQELIAAARLNTGPNSDSLGRPLKVSKEDMVGLMVALEQYLQRDHETEWAEWDRRVRVIQERLESVAGVRTERFVPGIANEAPHVRIRWAAGAAGMSPADVAQRLRDGEPSIEVVPVPSDEGCLEVAVSTLLDGEAEIVARRLYEILAGGR